MLKLKAREDQIEKETGASWIVTARASKEKSLRKKIMKKSYRPHPGANLSERD